MAKEKMSVKKKASAVVAGVLAVALAVGGAYAWTDYTQSARNTFTGEAENQVLLHDDFDGVNKDVYVENVGTSPVYVRVKFAEYLQIGNDSMLTAYSEDGSVTDKANPDDVTTWPIHQFVNADGNFDSGAAKSAHNYFTWEMTGESRKYLAGVTEDDGKGYGGLSEDAFNALPDAPATVTLGSITTQKMETLDAQAPMLLSTWLADEANRPENACWLLDTDGWAYWSAPLQPDTATNLLLDEVVQVENSAPYDNWAYNIDVQLQAVTPNDLNAWCRDGNAATIANPDNSVFTVSAAGFDLLQIWNGGPISTADGIYLGADGKSYESVGNNVYVEVDPATNEPYDATAYLLAGQDRMPGNADDGDNDDNMLAGRSLNNNGSSKQGGIAVTDINLENLTYKIAGGTKTDDIIVTAGIDNDLGTYDDVIISVEGSTVLGQYEIDGDTSAKELVGWNYLGGPIGNMLVTTEYVLNNVAPFGSNWDYRGSNLETIIEKITLGDSADSTTWPGFGMAAGYVNTVDVDMDKSQGSQVYVCIATDHEHNSANCNGNYYPSDYYTTEDIDTTVLSGKQFFALSINEVLEAYGDSTDKSVRQLRIAQAAPAYAGASHGLGGGGKNYNNSNDWKDLEITTTHYWLRSPGFTTDRAAYVYSNGNVDALTFVTNGNIGARPACYLNLE